MADIPRLTAWRSLLAFQQGGRRLDAILTENFSQTGLAGRDRAFAAELCHGVVRNLRALDCILAQGSSRPIAKIDAELVAVLRLGLYQAIGMSEAAFAAVNEAVNMAKSNNSTQRASGFINAVLRQTLRKISQKGLSGSPIYKIAESFIKPNMPIHSRFAEIYSFPDWWAKRWIERFGRERAREVFENCLNRSPVFIRLNEVAYTRTEIEDQLAVHGLITETFPFHSNLLKVSSGSLPPDSPLINQGYIQPQDGASFLAANLLPREPEGVALDICSGKGIKSGFFAGGFKRLLAFDSSHNALTALAQNMIRQRIENVSPVAADMSRPWPVRGSFSRIFLDAPCSGTGLAKRHPEGKWRKEASLIGRMSRVQSMILQEGVAHLAPGGKLVYAVCSVEREEGEDNIEAILKSDRSLARVPISELIPSIAQLQTAKGDMLILPGQYGMDGFFSSVLTRMQ